MKTKLLAIAMATCISSAASAQMSFQSGVIDFTYYDADFGPDIVLLGLEGRADYDIGTFGLQLDAGANVFTDFSDSLEQYSIGTHLYKQLNGTTKLGAYVGIDIFSGFGSSFEIYNYGVEGIKSFGAIDVEASIGKYAFFDSGGSVWGAGLDVYYTVSPSFELSLGVEHLFEDEFSFTTYNASATYSLQNLPISIGVGYISTEFFDRYSVSLSYEFGAPTDERLFKLHTYPAFTVGL